MPTTGTSHRADENISWTSDEQQRHFCPRTFRCGPRKASSGRRPRCTCICITAVYVDSRHCPTPAAGHFVNCNLRRSRKYERVGGYLGEYAAGKKCKTIDFSPSVTSRFKPAQRCITWPTFFSPVHVHTSSVSKALHTSPRNQPRNDNLEINTYYMAHPADSPSHRSIIHMPT